MDLLRHSLQFFHNYNAKDYIYQDHFDKCLPFKRIIYSKAISVKLYKICDPSNLINI
jgi:hypothetical protein